VCVCVSVCTYVFMCVCDVDRQTPSIFESLRTDIFLGEILTK